MAATPWLSNGVLNVWGSSAADHITVRTSFIVDGWGGTYVRQSTSVYDAGRLVATYNGAQIREIVVSGSDGADTIDLSEARKPSRVYGGTGNDTLLGSSANDQLYGAEGSDLVRGGAGHDTLHSAGWNLQDRTEVDTLFGGDGNDFIWGSNYGGTSASGEAGNDTLRGQYGRDTLSGGTGDDVLEGGSAEDSLTGGDGNDQVNGGGGRDTMDAGAGNDRLGAYWAGSTWIDDEGDDLFACGEGNDSVGGGYGSDSIRGGAGDDILWGDSDDDRIFGEAGNDSFYGHSGNDELFAGGGNDLVVAGGGNDTLVSIGGGQMDTLYGQAGNDNIWCDKESTERLQDAEPAEIASGMVHRVASFYTYRRSDSPNSTWLEPVSRELNGQNLAEPIGGEVVQDMRASPLFARSGPSHDDVRQGRIGDCWLLGTLSAIARTSVDRIRQAIVDLGDGTYAVQFNRGGKDNYIRIDGDLAFDNRLRNAGLGRDGSLWVALMEKAWAFFRRDSGRYDSLEGGWPSEVFSMFGSSSTSGPSANRGQRLLDHIRDQLAAGKAVTVVTRPGTASTLPVVGNHVYMADRVNVDSNGKVISVVLRNPWGTDGGGGNDGINDGYVTVTVNQVPLCFNKVTSAYV